MYRFWRGNRVTGCNICLNRSWKIQYESIDFTGTKNHGWAVYLETLMTDEMLTIAFLEGTCEQCGYREMFIGYNERERKDMLAALGLCSADPIVI